MNHAHQIYRERRDALLQSMRARGGGLALVPTAPEVARNRDSLFAYRHDSYFYYLSGFAEPEAVLALIAGPDGDRHVLFCRERNEEREIWDGFRYGPDAARDASCCRRCISGRCRVPTKRRSSVSSAKTRTSNA